MDVQPDVRLSDMLAIGFGTTVAMWAIAYVGHMPLVQLPPSLFVGLMLFALVVGGWLAGRTTRRGLRGGIWVGLISAALNLLILGSLLREPGSGQLVPQAWLWVPGWFAVSVLLAAIGALAGKTGRPTRRGTVPFSPTMLGAWCPENRDSPRSQVNWLAAFAWITCLAALLLITAGGLVTGFRAGMAVPDWPNTFGSNMFLYPLSRMTGGVFYEHAHRLLGTLVGMATLVLAVQITAQGDSPIFVERKLGQSPACPFVGRKGLVRLVWLVGAGVVVQGVLGGFRVTDDSHCLAVVHGCFAHAVLGGLVAIAVLLCRGPTADSAEHWQSQWHPVAADRFLTALLAAVVLLQTLLGTLVRQLNLTLLSHAALAAIVVLCTLGAGMRAWGLRSGAPVLRRFGVALMLLVVLQVSLGIVAVAFRTPPVGDSPSAEALAAAAGRLPIATVPALITTAHQATAAVILGVAMALAAWTWRLAKPA